MAGRGGYVNGRYVANLSSKGRGKGGGDGRGRDGGGRSVGWANNDGEEKWERKPGDDQVTLERKFDIDILQPGDKRVGYLFNLKVSRHYDESGRMLSALLLYFLQRNGTTFRCTFLYRPYFFVQISSKQSVATMKDILADRFANEGVFAEVVDKEDLDLEDHIVGRSRKLIKLSFENVDGMSKARNNLSREMRQKRNTESFSFDAPDKGKAVSAMESIEQLYEFDVDYINRVCIDKKINCGRWFDVERKQMATSADDIWDTQCIVTAKEDMLYKPGLRIFAWDIECTKEPLKFPDSAHDRITMISVMVDGSGFLIVNRAEVSADIEPLEYTPKPEFEGVFQTYNEEDEAALLKRFFKLTQDTNPHVMVSFNGDFFDYPFVTNRAKVHNLDWESESGIAKVESGGDYYVGKWIVHLDCFAWVQRDSYLPCGARGLKAVTRYKLKYDPVELDPEDMTPFAKERPQELAAYSVSDAVATYYLYMKYIHDFIFALCSIIPYGPDDVLRKGSGTLCESLLMKEAFAANVIFPNKHVDPLMEFHEPTNRLIEQSSYEGARVECMRVGVYRADIQETFQLEPSAFRTLLEDLKPTVDFYLTEEEKVKIEDVENYHEVLAEVEKTLKDLCDPDKVAAQLGRASQSSPQKSGSQQDEYTLKLVEYEVVEGSGGIKSGKKVKKASYRVIKDDFPLIYHLDVGAMYPNIILSNRLQPSAIVSKEFCNACSYNDPANKCKKDMDWKWRGELYMATRADVRAIMNEMEDEKRKYNHKDRDSQQTVRATWKELTQKEQTHEITKAVREFSQKAYRRVKSSYYEDKRDTVCQRENSFYVDTVRNFRDRRYMFKRAVKEWNKKLEKAQEAGDLVATMEAKDMVLLNDSLQLAHKCILNSFYGYVMRKGARWHSMKMAGIVTYTGSNLIREAREFCEQVGLPLELDTDGIWCLLPKQFPDVFKIKMKGGKEMKMPYPNCVLNYRVHQKYTNHQYQYWEGGEWKMRDENSIFFEIDGPYKSMVIPSSTEEDKLLKKRYCVFEHDGSIAELKGFEVKRRGELRLIQVFQTEVFPEFLKGTTKQEVYDLVGAMANRWLDVIESKGRTMTDDEVIYFFSESKSMSKSVEASGNYKSVQITTAIRLAEFLGVPDILKSESLSCHLLIANKPHGASATQRAIPVKIFSAEYEVKKQWLRRWLGDNTLNDFDMRNIIDWDYYRERLVQVFLKLICIPAAYQNISNPCPRVKLPDWLRKRVAVKNDRFQQSSLGLWLRIKNEGAGLPGSPDASKRKLCDIEDFPGAPAAGHQGGAAGAEAPLVAFGRGPKRWLEAQRLRWQATPQASLAAAGGWRQSLFHEASAWAPLSAETLRSEWHVVSMEPAQVLRSGSDLRAGDAVLVNPDDEEEATIDELSAGELQPGKVVGFVGGLVRVALETGEERLLSRGAVRPAKEEGLFVCWVSTGLGLSLHRCELLARRRVVLALESDFSPEGARCAVKPAELVKGLRVWPRQPNERRVGPGLLTSAAPEIGLCSVTWESGVVEAVFAADLERQGGSAARVLRDPPRNMQHACLIELEMAEDEFQRQRHEGSLGDRDESWPRIDSVYEAEQPLDFDVRCRLGATVKLVAPEKAEAGLGRGLLRLSLEDTTRVPHGGYLAGLVPQRNVYVHLCFDAARPSRAFCGIFSPILAEAWACFGGIDPAEGETMRPALEQALAEQLAQSAGGDRDDLSFVRAEASFVSGKSLSAIAQWIDTRLEDVRQRDGGHVCVLCSQLPAAELRGLSQSLYIDHRHQRRLSALREMPVCTAPFPESDSSFPTLDWQRWVSRRFASKVPQLFGWWRHRLSLCRAAGVPVCNAPEKPWDLVPHALDTLYARLLQKDSQIRWASVTGRPDLGDASLALVDAQEENLEAMKWTLQGKDLKEGRGGGQINQPGTYRSVCLELNLRTKLCICALQHARWLSDMEGGELSRKMIRKVQAGADGAQSRNLDHTSEVSLTSFESLVSLVQEIAAVRESKEKDIVALYQEWVAQGPTAREAAKEAGLSPDVCGEDDSEFVKAMQAAGHADARLAGRLEELRAEHDAQSTLLDGLYSWLASPLSLLYDPALLRKVHQYMDRVLQLFLGTLKRNGCQVIHASYSKVLFATGKLQVLPDVQNFWAALCENVNESRALQPLALNDPKRVTNYFYGMMWMDPANWAGVPIDPSNGEVLWKVCSHWKAAELLPPAVRPSLTLYVGELLLRPQQELWRRQEALRPAASAEDAPAEPAAPAPEAMDMDAVPGDCAVDSDEERCDGPAGAGGDVPMADAGEAPAAPEGGAEAKADAAGTDAADPNAKGSEVLEELRDFIQGPFFEDLRRRVLKCIEDMQGRQQRELAAAAAERPPEADGPESGDEEEATSDSEPEDGVSRARESGPGREARKAEERRRHVEEKWSYPNVAGRRTPPGAVDFEFMRTLIQLLGLEDCVADQVVALRDRICQKIRISSFGRGVSFDNPCFPLILRNVVCPWCSVASPVDVTSHHAKGPGLWVCPSCDHLYDKEAIQSRLVGLLESVVQAWQSQEISCKKCKRLKPSRMQTHCECFGRFEVNFTEEDFELVLHVLRSLCAPHDLPSLQEALDLCSL